MQIYIMHTANTLLSCFTNPINSEGPGWIIPLQTGQLPGQFPHALLRLQSGHTTQPHLESCGYGSITKKSNKLPSDEPENMITTISFKQNKTKTKNKANTKQIQGKYKAKQNKAKHTASFIH